MSEPCVHDDQYVKALRLHADVEGVLISVAHGMMTPEEGIAAIWELVGLDGTGRAT